MARRWFSQPMANKMAEVLFTALHRFKLRVTFEDYHRHRVCRALIEGAEHSFTASFDSVRSKGYLMTIKVRARRSYAADMEIVHLFEGALFLKETSHRVNRKLIWACMEGLNGSCPFPVHVRTINAEAMRKVVVRGNNFHERCFRRECLTDSLIWGPKSPMTAALLRQYSFLMRNQVQPHAA